MEIITPSTLEDNSVNHFQRILDSDGILELPKGNTYFNQKIVLKANQSIVGKGFSSRLVYQGTDNYGIEVGDGNISTFQYYSELKDFCLENTGIKLKEIAQNNVIRNVVVHGANQDGFLFDNVVGERAVLENCYASENKRHGFNVQVSKTSNGICLNRCNSQNNNACGILVETSAVTGQILDTMIINCTVQKNQRITPGAGILIKGYVNHTAIRDSWVEEIDKVGVIAQSSSYLGSTTIRRPLGFIIEGLTTISQCSKPLILQDCYMPEIDALKLFGKNQFVYWSGYGEPIGRKKHLKLEQIVKL